MKKMFVSSVFTLLSCLCVCAFQQLPENIILENPLVAGDFLAAQNKIWNTQTQEIVHTSTGYVTILTPNINTTVQGINTFIYSNSGDFIAEIPGYPYKFSTAGSYLWSYSADQFKAYSESGQLLSNITMPASNNLSTYPGEVRYRKASTIYKRDFTTSTEQAVGSFTGTFASWFLDGEHFLTYQGNIVRLYNKNSVFIKLVDMAATTTANLGGSGNYFWVWSGSQIFLHRIDNTTVTTYDYGYGSSVSKFPGYKTIGLLPSNGNSFSIIELAETGPVVTTHSVRGINVSTFIADTAGNWATGNMSGVINYGNLTDAPKLLNTGKIRDIFGNRDGHSAIATSSGHVLVYHATAGSITQADTLDFDADKVMLSLNGRYLAYREYKVNSAGDLFVYDLITKTLVKKWDYTYSQQNGSGTLVDGFDFSEDGSTITQKTAKIASPAFYYNFISTITPPDSTFLNGDRLAKAAKISPTKEFAMTSEHPVLSDIVPVTEDLTKLYHEGNLINAFTGYSPGWISDNLFLLNRQENIICSNTGPWNCVQHYSVHIYSVTGDIDTQYTIPAGLGTPQQIAEGTFSIYDLRAITDHEFLVNNTTVIDIESGEIPFAPDGLYLPIPQWVPLGPDHLIGVRNNDLKIIQWRATLTPVWYKDADGDGFGDASISQAHQDQPSGFVSNSTDCDDSNVNIHPNLVWYADADADGFGNISVTLTQCTQPSGFVSNSSDCNDTNVSIHPNTLWYADADADGFGNSAVTQTQCTQPSGFVSNSTDCNDTNVNIHPNTLWYADADADGFGNSTATQTQCTQPSGFVSNSSDCNDTNVNIHPNTLWYADADADGFGNSAATQTQCTQPSGFVSNSTDCNDTNVNIHPNTLWYADADADGFGNSAVTQTQCTQPSGFVSNSTDCNDTNINIHSNTLWYADADADGFGNSAVTQTQCTQPSGFVSNSTDCNDTNINIHSNTLWYADADADGFGNSAVTQTQCTQPSGFVSNSTDCNDTNINIHPNTLWYADADADGFGNSGVTQTQCTQPSGFVSNSTDCNDTNVNIHPNTLWYADADADGFGNSAVTQTQCTQPSGFVSNSTDCDDTNSELTPLNFCMIITGIENSVLQNSVHPNPGNGIYSIRHNGKNLDLKVINPTGRVVDGHIARDDQFYRIDISDESAGLYYFKVFTGPREIIYKIIKQ
jgi:hypothetical protein